MGRPPIGDRALTAAERQRRSREARRVAGATPATKPAAHPVAPEVERLRADLAHERARSAELEARLAKGPPIAAAEARIADLEAQLFKLSKNKGAVSMSAGLHRRIVKALHPDLAADVEEKTIRTALAAEYNALPIIVIAEESKARLQAKAREWEQSMAEAAARGEAKRRERSERAKEARRRSKERKATTEG